jgi:mannan endo-1,4-beta-mannosidase
MKVDRRLLLLPLLSLSLASACRGLQDMNEDSKLAQISIEALENQDYTSYEFAMEQQNGSFRVPLTTYNRGEQKIALKVPVGTYQLTLNYLKDKKIVLSSMLCRSDKKNDIQTFVAGLNTVPLLVCGFDGLPVNADVVIKPVPVDPGKPGTPNPKPTPSPDNTFSIQNGSLIDPSGKPFVIRGINVPFAYYFDQSFTAIDNVKATGFNSIRVVWCADNYQDNGGRCQPKDFRTAADLDRVLTKITDMQLVTVFNLQNATGQNSTDALDAMTTYLLKDDIKAVLMKHKENVIVNIANEWMGAWDKNRTWVDGYRSAIEKLRKAGFPHVLVVDARGYGQDFSSIEEHATELMTLDKNLLFSSHMYAVYNTDQIVQEKLQVIRDRKIPFMIGEFGCTHYDDSSGQNKTVACDAILKETAKSTDPIGTMAWSYTGNRSQEADLDVFKASDWKTLSSYGEKVVNGTYGVKATAKTACYFEPTSCR